MDMRQTSGDQASTRLPDVQALADLGGSYSAIDEMRIVPFGLREIAQLAAVTAISALGVHHVFG